MLKIYDCGHVHKSNTYSKLYFQDNELDTVKKMIEDHWTNFYQTHDFYGDWQDFFWKTIKTKKGTKYRFYSMTRFKDRKPLSWEKPFCMETILVLPNV